MPINVRIVKLDSSQGKLTIKRCQGLDLSIS